MEKFKWGGVDKREVYMDENNLRMTMNLRSNFERLASNLIDEGKPDLAIKALDRCFEVLPENNVPYNFFVIQLSDAYYRAGVTDKPDQIMTKYAGIVEAELRYFFKQKRHIQKDFESEIQRNMSIYKYLIDTAKKNRRDQLVAKLQPVFDSLESQFMAFSGQVITQ